MSKRMLCAVVMMACSIAAFSQNDDKANVLQVERSLATALGKRDAVTINSLFADDASIINSTGNIVNKQQLIQSVQTMNGVTFSDMQVKVTANIAVVTGTEVVTGVDNGPYTNKLRFTNVLERKNNQWQIIAAQQTSLAQ